MSQAPHKVEERMMSIVHTLSGRLSPTDSENIISLVRAGEWGVALENLCTQLYEYDIDVPVETYQDIASVGEAMGIEPRYWENLTISG
jgi:hypothetical protein